MNSFSGGFITDNQDTSNLSRLVPPKTTANFFYFLLSLFFIRRSARLSIRYASRFDKSVHTRGMISLGKATHGQAAVAGDDAPFVILDILTHSLYQEER